jgi:dolichol-phosphate mannosyltransferase
MTQQMTCNGSREAAILLTEQLSSGEGGKVGSNVLRRVKKADIWQFVRFCIVGSLNAVIDFGVLNLLLWLYPTTTTWKILGYNSVAVLLAATNSFFWNKYWTFQKRSPITFQEVYRFIVVASGTMLMNDTLMWLLGGIFPGIMRSSLLGANALKLGAIIGTMSISFFGMRLWVFFQKRYAGEAQSLADDATKRLPTIKLVYDVETVIAADLKLAFDVDPISAGAPSRSRSSLPAVDAALARYSISKPRRVMKTLIIIPTYNEVENLPLLMRQIFLYAPATDVLIVDDNSPDGTGKLAEELKRRNHQIHVLHRSGKLGLGTAYIAGFKYAIQHGYDAAFEMDADFSHDPRYLPDFLKAIEHADLVMGSRYISGGSTPNWSFIRRLISGSGNIFARFVLGISVRDCTGGFRCYHRQVLQSIDLGAIQSRGYAFQVELTYRVLKQGFNIVETPITFLDRRLGTSKMTRMIVVEAFMYVLRTRFREGMFFRGRLAGQRSFPITFEEPMEHQQVEEPKSFALIQASFSSSYASALPDTPLPGLHSKQTQVRNLHPVKLLPCPSDGASRGAVRR